MTKPSLILTSLVAAIPGGIMVVLIVMAILSKSENMTGIFHAVNALLLIVSAAAMLMPVIIAVFYGREGTAPVSEPTDANQDDADPVADEPVADADGDDDEGDFMSDDDDGFDDDDDDLSDFEDDDDDWE